MSKKLKINNNPIKFEIEKIRNILFGKGTEYVDNVWYNCNLMFDNKEIWGFEGITDEQKIIVDKINVLLKELQYEKESE